MDVVGCRRHPAARERDAAAGVSKVYGLDELPQFLGACDYIVSVLPSTPGTRGLLDGSAPGAHECQLERLARRRPVPLPARAPRTATARA